MATFSNIVETVVKLNGGPEFQRQAAAAAKSVMGIGKATEDTGKKAKLGYKGLAAWAGGAATIYKAGHYVHSAVQATEDLAKSTLTLQRATNLDAQTASAYAEILKVRGVGTRTFQVGLVKLSRTMEQARQGNTKAIETFRMLGVSQDAISSGNVNDALLQTADAMKRIQSPAQRAALAQQVLGRSAGQLMPLLMSGSEGIQEQVDLVKRYGATLGSTEGAKEMIARQREMQYAMDGLKVTLGTSLLPAIESILGALMKWIKIFQPFLRNTVAVQLALGALVTAFVVYKGVVVAAMLAQLGFSTALIRTRLATLLATAAMAGLNLTMLLIPALIAGVIVVLIVLYKKWGWFHNAVDATFRYIKAHWPLLLAILVGPFAVATLLVIRNLDKIKAAFGSTIHWVAQRWRDLVALVSRVADTIGGVVSTVTHPGRLLSKVPGLHGAAAGGTITAGGSTLVGERGPEVVTLPRAAKVIPLERGALAGAVGPQTVITQVFLERRQIAEAVGSYTADTKARR